LLLIFVLLSFCAASSLVRSLGVKSGQHTHSKLLHGQGGALQSSIGLRHFHLRCNFCLSNFGLLAYISGTWWKAQPSQTLKVISCESGQVMPNTGHQQIPFCGANSNPRHKATMEVKLPNNCKFLMWLVPLLSERLQMHGLPNRRNCTICSQKSKTLLALDA